MECLWLSGVFSPGRCTAGGLLELGSNSGGRFSLRVAPISSLLSPCQGTSGGKAPEGCRQQGVKEVEDGEKDGRSLQG